MHGEKPDGSINALVDVAVTLCMGAPSAIVEDGEECCIDSSISAVDVRIGLAIGEKVTPGSPSAGDMYSVTLIDSAAGGISSSSSLENISRRLCNSRIEA